MWQHCGCYCNTYNYHWKFQSFLAEWSQNPLMKWRITPPVYPPPRSSQTESTLKRESPDSRLIPSHHFVTSLICRQVRSSWTRWTLWRSAWVLRTAKMTCGGSWYAPTLRCPSSLKRTRLNRWWSPCLCCNVTCLILGCPKPSPGGL